MSRTAMALSALLFLAPTIGFADAIDEATVRRVIAEVDRAIDARDADAVVRHMSDSVVITADVEAGGQSQHLTMNKSDYLQMLRQAWAAVQAYDYQRSNVRIAISRGRAVVTADILETITMQGRTMRTTSTESTVFELVNGKLMATSVSARSRT